MLLSNGSSVLPDSECRVKWTRNGIVTVSASSEGHLHILMSPGYSDSSRDPAHVPRTVPLFASLWGLRAALVMTLLGGSGPRPQQQEVDTVQLSIPNTGSGRRLNMK